MRNRVKRLPPRQIRRPGVKRHAHATAATAMFVATRFAGMVNAGWPHPLRHRIYHWLREEVPPSVHSPRHLRYRTWYCGLSLFMVAAAVVIAATLPFDWEQRVFWLEVCEILGFGLFWTLQTLEGWDIGVLRLADDRALA